MIRRRWGLPCLVIAALAAGMLMLRGHERAPAPVQEAYLKPAPPLAVAAPLLTIEEDAIQSGRRLVRATLRSQRDAFVMMLALPGSSPIESVSINGQAVLAGASVEPRAIGLHGLGDAPVRIEMSARAGVPLALVALDITSLDDRGEAGRLRRARPSIAAPLQRGDQSVALRRIHL